MHHAPTLSVGHISLEHFLFWSANWSSQGRIEKNVPLIFVLSLPLHFTLILNLWLPPRQKKSETIEMQVVHGSLNEGISPTIIHNLRSVIGCIQIMRMHWPTESYQKGALKVLSTGKACDLYNKYTLKVTAVIFFSFSVWQVWMWTYCGHQVALRGLSLCRLSWFLRNMCW